MISRDANVSESLVMFRLEEERSNVIYVHHACDIFKIGSDNQKKLILRYIHENDG